ncbi:MAG TPA: CDP-diacylglycerol--glycerol-3-phosphate 3-phosphatidyltransferase [Planctomycetaceae bacterium]|nr:CDP-diacylglycerol--glycerol-3-phosphate 3-phosphatidyltransferase [Planctomycetaceae bacterium]
MSHANSEKSVSSNPSLNVPNMLTSSRLALSVLMFVLVGMGYYFVGMIVFIIAATTDWVDGYWARKYGQVTVLGRILDPFADKVIICGSFIFLMAVPAMQVTDWGLRAWMVVVVVAREMLVTMLRGIIEKQGGDFSARWSGKWKMVLQCVAVGVCLFYLSYPIGKNQTVPDSPPWVYWLMVASVWSAIVLTIYSGLIYIGAAIKILRK